MAVRELTPTTDYLRTSIGALGSMTYGTFAGIFKLASFDATLIALLTSGSAFVVTPLQWNGTAQLDMFVGAGLSHFGSPAMSGNWVLAVVRKATGTATPRLSWCDLGTGVWAHVAGSAARADWAAPTSGFVNTATNATNGEGFDGRIAVTAAWSNSLPWTADTTGDTAIEAAGLQTSLANWVAASPSALWPWNPTVAAGLADITGNGANQVAISGTTEIAGDDPPGFSFALGSSSMLTFLRPMMTPRTI